MQSLKITIDSMLRKYGIDNAVAQNKALTEWEKAVGKTVAKNAVPEKVEHGVVIVKVSSPTWRQELYLQKKDIIEALGQQTQADIVGLIGHVVILFKSHSDPEKRTIFLPKKSVQD